MINQTCLKHQEDLRTEHVNSCYFMLAWKTFWYLVFFDKASVIFKCCWSIFQPYILFLGQCRKIEKFGENGSMVWHRPDLNMGPLKWTGCCSFEWAGNVHPCSSPMLFFYILDDANQNMLSLEAHTQTLWDSKQLS